MFEFTIISYALPLDLHPFKEKTSHSHNQLKSNHKFYAKIVTQPLYQELENLPERIGLLLLVALIYLSTPALLT